MSVPDYQDFMRPILEGLVDGKTHSVGEIKEYVIDRLQLSPADLEERIRSGGNTKVRSRLGYARLDLQIAGLLTGGNGFYEITGQGRDVLKQHPQRIDRRVLAQFPDWAAAQRQRPRVSKRVPWRLRPGDHIERTQLHAEYGGRTQGGITTSSESPNVFFFTDPAGRQHGYHDHWDGDVLHYFGEGQRGDMAMVRGNRAIRDHSLQNRSLRGFQGVGGVIGYLGEFELDPDEPFYTTRTPETGGGPMRQAIVFKLVPLDYTPESATHKPGIGLSTPYRHANKNVRSAARAPFQIDPNAVDRSLQSHARLQEMLHEHVEPLDATVHSPGALDPDFDIAWETSEGSRVAEVKSLTAANEVSQLRLGLGQVLHYKHLMSRDGHEVRAVLFVEREPADMGWVELCASHGVDLLWPEILDRLMDS